jgi:hypothetical protein
MLVRRSVLYLCTAGAVITASAKLGIERVQQFDIDSGERLSPDDRADVLADLALVPAAGRRVDVDNREPPAEQLVDRRSCARVALLVDLVE